MALRHAPEHFGLTLSAEGWVTVEELIKGLTQFSSKWSEVTPADLEQMDVNSGKQRFEIVDGRIRALYGHSTKETQITYTAIEPPEVLYHGTANDVSEVILEEGLKPMNRQYVHLSDKIETATIVGKRKEKKPTLLIIRAKDAFANGIGFFHGNDNTWLAEAIPPQYISKKE